MWNISRNFKIKNKLSNKNRVQNIDEQRKFIESSQLIIMPFNLNNVDVTVWFYFAFTSQLIKWIINKSS